MRMWCAKPVGATHHGRLHNAQATEWGEGLDRPGRGHPDLAGIYQPGNMTIDARKKKFECAVHDRVQKPARLVSARKLGPTDVPRSRRVRPGGVRRCDSLALRLSSDRPQTEHARRHASTHVRAAGRCTPVGLRTEVVCVGVNLLLTGVAY